MSAVSCNSTTNTPKKICSLSVKAAEEDHPNNSSPLSFYSIRRDSTGYVFHDLTVNSTMSQNLQQTVKSQATTKTISSKPPIDFGKLTCSWLVAPKLLHVSSPVTLENRRWLPLLASIPDWQKTQHTSMNLRHRSYIAACQPRRGYSAMKFDHLLQSIRRV